MSISAEEVIAELERDIYRGTQALSSGSLTAEQSAHVMDGNKLRRKKIRGLRKRLSETERQPTISSLGFTDEQEGNQEQGSLSSSSERPPTLRQATKWLRADIRRYQGQLASNRLTAEQRDTQERIVARLKRDLGKYQQQASASEGDRTSGEHRATAAPPHSRRPSTQTGPSEDTETRAERSRVLIWSQAQRFTKAIRGYVEQQQDQDWASDLEHLRWANNPIYHLGFQPEFTPYLGHEDVVQSIEAFVVAYKAGSDMKTRLEAREWAERLFQAEDLMTRTVAVLTTNISPEQHQSYGQYHGLLNLAMSASSAMRDERELRHSRAEEKARLDAPTNPSARDYLQRLVELQPSLPASEDETVYSYDEAIETCVPGVASAKVTSPSVSTARSTHRSGREHKDKSEQGTKGRKKDKDKVQGKKVLRR